MHLYLWVDVAMRAEIQHSDNEPNCPPLKLEYTQNILLPQLDPTVRFDPGDPSTHDPFMRTRGVAAPMVVGDRFAVTNKDGS